VIGEQSSCTLLCAETHHPVGVYHCSSGVLFGSPSCEVQGTLTHTVSKVTGSFDTAVRFPSGSSLQDSALTTAMKTSFAAAFGIATESIDKFELSTKSVANVQGNSNLRRLDTLKDISVIYELTASNAEASASLENRLASFSWSSAGSTGSVASQVFVQEMLKSTYIVTSIEATTPRTFEDAEPTLPETLEPRSRTFSMRAVLAVCSILILVVACCVGFLIHKSCCKRGSNECENDVSEAGKSVGIASRSIEIIRSFGRRPQHWRNYAVSDPDDMEKDPNCASVPLRDWDVARLHPHSCTQSKPLSQSIGEFSDVNGVPTQ